jgi:hypothetical protein
MVTCQAQLKNYTRGPVSFDWEYWVSYKLKRHDTPQWVDLCDREAKIEFTGTSVGDNTNTSLWQVPFTTSNINYIEFKAQQPERDPKLHPYYGGDCQNIINTWTDGSNVFIGGYVWVKVTAKDQNGNILAFDTLSVNKILGNNPSDANIIYNYAGSNEIKAILIHEGKTKQFADDASNWPQLEPGWPLYGYPNGYGLMQLDNNPAPTENQLWNWKANLDVGKNKYFNIKSITKKWMNKEAGKQYSDNDEVVLKCSFQKYNYYKKYLYKWIPQLQKWEIDDSIPKETQKINNVVIKDYYGVFVYNIYNGL